MDNEMEIGADVAEAIASAKQSLAAQHSALGIEPDILVIEVAGLVAVCRPWPVTRRNLAFRQASGLPELERGLKLAEAVVVDTVHWVRGQQEDGPAGAVKYLRALAAVGGRYTFVFDKIGGEYLRMTDELGGVAQGKKL